MPYIRSKNKHMRVAVVGATGMVGHVMLEVLAERQFPITELIPVSYTHLTLPTKRIV